MTSRNPKVDAYLRQAKTWPGEMKKLRMILLRFPLIEEFKWGKPCYSFGKSNVVILIPLKDSCALMFCKGALLKDAAGLLLKPGENTQAGRWIKFTSGREITDKKAILEAYLEEAIEAEKAGLKVKYKRTSDYSVPEELQKKWRENPSFKKAFAALTPGRQRGYFLYFSAPKQSKTRESRIEKSREKIVRGKGFNER
jgi:uncharacterized protein YdeI (YjbR/CyaY-like superfamily)